MIKKEMRSGFQRKYLKYTLALLLLALLLSSVGVAAYVKRNMTAAVIDKYGFVTEKMGLSLDNLYRKSDEVTAECILNDSVQDSLKGKPLGDLARKYAEQVFCLSGSGTDGGLLLCGQQGKHVYPLLFPGVL